MDEPVVRIDGLWKTFARLRSRVIALRDVHLEVRRGSVVAFVGPNGAGKTTTIYAMLGLLAPTRGRVTILGQPAGSIGARRRLGFMSEIFYTYPFYTARSALRFYGRLAGLSPATLAERIPHELARVGLGDAMDRRVGSFSKGMVQRLGLAQAMVHEPELLILDEPTTGLDPEGRRLVAELILAEKARGTTVFLSSHILSDVERTCDHVVMIRRGEVVVSEPMAGLAQGADEWEIEVAGWSPGLAVALGDATVATPADGDGIAWLTVPTSSKHALLRRLLDLGADVGTVRRSRPSLEDLYMRHVGGTSSG